MSPNNNPNRMMMRAMGPAAFFTTILAFILPPIGFLIAFRGFWVDRQNGERYVGWIVLMVIATLSSIIMIVGLIMLLIYGDNTAEEIAILLL